MLCLLNARIEPLIRRFGVTFPNKGRREAGSSGQSAQNMRAAPTLEQSSSFSPSSSAAPQCRQTGAESAHALLPEALLLALRPCWYREKSTMLGPDIMTLSTIAVLAV
jgi:hypothetical protein